MRALGAGLRDLPVAGMERELHEAVQRMARGESGRGCRGRMAVVLHLSRLAPPAPRPHHARIARVLLEDTASRHEGRVFALQGGDMVLLCRDSVRRDGPPVGRATVAHPGDLPDILTRLLLVDTPAGAWVVSLWRLEHEMAELLAYSDDRLRRRNGSMDMEEDVAGHTGIVDAIGLLLGREAAVDMLQRQTAVRLQPGGPGGLVPIYREVTFSMAALEARTAAPAPVASDPFLFRHLATRLDRRLLEILRREVGRHGPLDARAAGEGAAVLHVNLTLEGVLSPAFGRFAAACAGGAVGVEISLIEAVADAPGFARARALVAAAGFSLVLDGVTHLAMLLSRPWALGADLVKLDWSPRLIDLGVSDRGALEDALDQTGREHVVLARAETETALQWGMMHGVRRFQGRHVDAMLGAARIVGCAEAGGCALRQCIDRAAAPGQAGRQGCRNQALLDGMQMAPLSAPLRPAVEAL